MNANEREPGATIYTIGHSTVSQSDFLSTLKNHKIEALADIRRFPGSKRHPWFGQNELKKAIEEAGLEYHWFDALGGHRKSGAESPNIGLRNAAFRAYADHMRTAEFQAAARELMRIARATPTAYMCAEMLYWRCHRMLLSDYFTAHGWTVIHIMGEAAKPHRLTPGARLDSGELLYLPVEGPLLST